MSVLKNMITRCALLMACVALAPACSDSDEDDGSQEAVGEEAPVPTPPVAAIQTDTLVMFDTVIYDDYAWLKDKKDPEVIAYLEAENAYGDSLMAGTEEVRQSLYDEMRSRIKEEQRMPAVRNDDYYYYTRYEAGKEYAIHCRKKDSMSAEEEILLDENKLAEGEDYFRLGQYKVSPDHSHLAYTVDLSGNEIFTLFVKDLRDQTMLTDSIPGLSWSLDWATDNQTLFYSVQDEAKRPYKIFRHGLGTPYSDDKQVYHEEDERFFVDVRLSRSQQYLLISSESQVTSEVHLLPADDPYTKLSLFAPRKQGVKYSVMPHDNTFFILTNANAVNYKLMQAGAGQTRPANWQEVIGHREDITLESAQVFKDHVAIIERETGLQRIGILPVMNPREAHYIQFDEEVYALSREENPDFNTDTLRFGYRSLVMPYTVYDYSVSDRSRKMVHREEVPNYNPDAYESRRIMATAKDGTSIPVSMVFKKGTNLKANNPLLLYGYGSYGSVTSPSFRADRVSLLDRGMVFAIAHIRGSGDMGEKWYQAGKLMNKKNTFTDFIACAEHLVNEGYTSPEKLVANGRSAGGLLMGAVANMRPDLFKLVMAEVPFVDVINTMLDPNLPLTVIEYEEWGNPNKQAYFEYMLSYSPYNNVKEQAYPNMLFTGGLNDPRVGYWEPAKMAAAVREANTGNNTIMLRTNMGSGHFGASGRFSYLEEVAFKYAFMFKLLGIEADPGAGSDDTMARAGDTK
ncbi:S9 family peptidase [Roseivirga sp. BDSF3-8]|uniref:S9 family peptidase n=1 Tax=Roseivirga sp. BDSF3-8 TaxID=3241598 RepID=UPI00353230A5